MVGLLIKAGHDDSTTTLCTAIRNLTSFRNCHNLRGDFGLNQLRRMFSENYLDINANYIAAKKKSRRKRNRCSG